MTALARALLLAFAGLALSCGFAETPCPVPAANIAVGCPTTFDGTEADLPRCGAEGGLVSARTCGELNELVAEIAAIGRACVYDSATHRLVGARILPGAPTICGPDGFNQTWGRQVDRDCRDAPPALMHDCGAGGSSPG